MVFCRSQPARKSVQMSVGYVGRSSRRVIFALALTLCLASRDASAQKLSIQGDRFAVDGQPKFLVFISFFGAMGAPNIAQDLKFLRSAGFDGVRIWPNLDTGPQLMNGDGSLRPDELQHLKFILDRAREEGLIVDVSFTHEHISGMTIDTALTGIVNATEALRQYDNILFDIQNERNVGDRRYMSEGDVGRIYRAVKAVDPSRTTTADNSLGEDWGPQYASDFTARLGLDVTAFHEGRRADWYLPGFQSNVIGTLKQNGKPAYMQEPNSTRDRTYTANDRADYYIQAVTNAKLAGAAARGFHSMVGVNFQDGGAPLMEDRLRQYPEPEWTFVTSLKSRIMLRANSGVHYVVAEGGGGGDVRADRTNAGPEAWQTFTVTNISG